MKELLKAAVLAVALTLSMTTAAKASKKMSCSESETLENLENCLWKEHKITVSLARVLTVPSTRSSDEERSDPDRRLRQAKKNALKQLATAYDDNPELTDKDYRTIYVGLRTRFHEDPRGEQPTATIHLNLDSSSIADFLKRQKTDPEAVKEYENRRKLNDALAERIKATTGIEDVRCLYVVRSPPDCYAALQRIWNNVKEGPELEAKQLLVGNYNQQRRKSASYTIGQYTQGEDLKRYLNMIPRKKTSVMAGDTSFSSSALPGSVAERNIRRTTR